MTKRSATSSIRLDIPYFSRFVIQTLGPTKTLLMLFKRCCSIDANDTRFPVFNFDHPKPLFFKKSS